PELGIGYDAWSGMPLNTGITTDKNALGHICWVLGMFFVWHLLRVWRQDKTRARRNEIWFSFGFLYLGFWLLYMSCSSTSLISLLFGVSVLLFLGLRSVKLHYIGTYVLVGATVLALGELTFGLSAQVIKILGKDPTLTDRTEVWSDVLSIPINP